MASNAKAGEAAKTGLARSVTAGLRALLVAALTVLAPWASAQVVTYFHNDLSGTPILVTSSSGAVVWKEAYRPYGERLSNPAAEAGNRIGFAGKPYDPGTGLGYMGARYYDPVLGRFMGTDPEPFDEASIHSFNRYAYANNNPYRYVDPDGHSPVPIIVDETHLGRRGSGEALGVPRGIGGGPVPHSIEASRANLQYEQAATAAREAAKRTVGSPALKGDPYHSESVAARQRTWQSAYGGVDSQALAAELGYGARIPPQKAPFNSHGQPVFSNGRGYISPDVDGHNVTNGWKMFDAKGRRTGTWNSNLSERLKD